MNSTTILLIAVMILLLLLFFKAPVFVALLAGSAIYFVGCALSGIDINPAMYAQKAIGGVESLNLLAIPFFVFAGTLMNYTGITARIMDFCAVLTGRMHGGLAQVNILLSTLMGGLSGSNIADAAMEAKMLVPEMEKKGFSKPFSTVVTAASSMITPLIPPGIVLILYGVLSNVSVGKLFVAGISVGALLCLSLMLLVNIVSRKRGYAPLRKERVTGKEFWAALKPAILPLLLPIVIIGGIRIGVFTATEAGAVSIIYAMVLGLIYKEMKIKDFLQSLKETVITTASIMLIITGASVFSWILTREQIPQLLMEWIVINISNKYLFLMIINVFLIIIGMFIEGNASMIILVPLLAPIAAQYGIDPIAFAMMYIFNASIGAMSPPMGTLMFVTCGVTGCKTKDFIKESIPFFLLLFVDLMILTYIPFVSTFLVNLIY